MTTAIERAPKQEMAQITPLSLIQDALRKDVPPETLKELVALQQAMVRFEWEAQERQAKIDFDEALNLCQSQIGRIAPNAKRENNIMWADYAQIDRTIRPIYVRAGFSLAFSEMETAEGGRLRMKATLSRGGVSRDFFAEMPNAAANGKMNQADADASAKSRVKRYLVMDIFNIAVGIDHDEKAPYQQQVSPDAEARLQEWEDALHQCDDLNTLKTVFADAYKFAASVSPLAKQSMTRVYEDCKRRLA